MSEEKPVYYCFRRPDHAGGNLVGMLVKAGVERYPAIALLNKHRRRDAMATAEPVVKAATEQQKTWGRFVELSESARMLDYLESRGFPDPELVAERYDLRFARNGKWAARVLFPITENGAVVSWTGRAIRPEADIKYLTEDDGRRGLIYQPRPTRGFMVVVEGPFDALKVAASTERMDVAALALTGKNLNDARLFRIYEALREARGACVALDSDTAIHEASRVLAEVAGVTPGRNAKRLRLPAGWKDAGEMPMSDVVDWLAHASEK